VTPLLPAALLALAALPALQGSDLRRPPDVHVELRTSPIVDLYFEVRVRAEAGAAEEDDDPLYRAVVAAQALGETLGSPLAFGLVEGNLAECRTADDVRRAFGKLPTDFQLRTNEGESAHDLRAETMELADGLSDAESAWLADAWPPRGERLEATRTALLELLTPEHERALSDHLQRLLGTTVSGFEHPVHLVLRAPSPGGFTQRRMGGGAVSFVSVEGRSTSLLAEIVLHETLHGLDFRTSATPSDSLLGELRAALTAAGVNDRDQREVVHLVFFLAAGDAVRRVLAPQHVDYGESQGVYEKIGPLAEVARPLWRRYASGQIERPALVQGLVVAGRAAKRHASR